MTEERIVYSAVAIPGEPDYDGEILTPEEIRHAAHAYLRDYRIVDPEHVCALGQCKEVGNPVESYITTEPMTVKSYENTLMEFPIGTWIIGIDVFDDSTYNDIQNGVKTGVSLTAKRADGVTKSRVLIRDLGPDWVVKTVSIVKNPAVPKAKFFSIKRSDSMTENHEDNVTKGFDRVVEAIKGLREPIKEPREETVEPTYVTHEELEATKSEILEAIKAIAPKPEPEDEEDEGEGEGEATKGAEEDEKDKRIAELEAENQKLKSATKSKGIPDHFQTENGRQAIKNLYEDDGRDMYGRVIK